MSPEDKQAMIAAYAEAYKISPLSAQDDFNGSYREATFFEAAWLAGGRYWMEKAASTCDDMILYTGFDCADAIRRFQP